LLVNGDLDSDELVEEDALERIREDTTSVIHAAAVTYPGSAREPAWKTNVEGTSRLLALASEMPQIRTFVYVSDLAVAGDHIGPFSEGDLLRNQRFSGVYAETKLVGERRVRQAADRLPIRVVRPAGFVSPIGNGGTDELPPFQTLLRALIKLNRLSAGTLPIPFVPLGACARVQVLPVSWVAEALVQLWKEPGIDGLTFQLYDPDAPTVRALIEDCAGHLGMPSPGVNIPRRAWSVLSASVPIADRVLARLNTPEELIGDGFSRVARCSVPDGTRAERVLRSADLEAPHLGDYLGPLLEYTESSLV